MKNKLYPRTILLLTFVISLLSTSLYGQIPTRFIDPKESRKFGINSNRDEWRDQLKSIKRHSLPSIDLKALQREDSLEREKGLPFRFGKDIDVDINILNSALVLTAGDTSRYFFQIESKKAYSLNLIFNDFYLTDNASVLIYNVDRTMIYGPITANHNPENGVLWTDLLQGSSIIIEVTIIGNTAEASRLHLSKIVHGYQNVFAGGNGESLACHNDVVCQGAWENDAQMVGMVIQADGTRHCSGSLIMTTDRSFRPYFLTAFHCLDLAPNKDGALSPAERSQVNNWVFRFRYQRKTSNCTPSYFVADVTDYWSFNGANFRSAYQPADMTLLELYSTPGLSANTVYGGWSRSTTPATSAVAIHYPNGDVKKISIDTNPLTNIAVSTTWGAGLVSGANTHWASVFESGTTEGGSSGSPILDQNRRIVGQLHGDYLNTDNNFCTNRRAQYGRFDVSWAGGGTDDTRLSKWLDP
jgi:hypothetical protein